jgi:hypothetical protein
MKLGQPTKIPFGKGANSCQILFGNIKTEKCVSKKLSFTVVVANR